MAFSILANEPGSGGHRDKGSTSLAAIAATFVPTAITAAVYLIAFFFLRSTYRNIYAPRTYFRTIPEKSRTPTTRANGRKWYHDFLWIDDKFILQHNSLEAYLFLRFFRVLIVICFVGCCLTWPVLFPVNITGGGDATQLDRLSFSNATGKHRLYAHAVVAWLFVTFIVLLITRERMFVIGLKQAYLTTKANAKRLSSRTVLFLSAPAPALVEENLKRYFGPHAKRAWPVSKIQDLQSLVDKRNEKIYALEEAEIKLAMNVNSAGKDRQSSSNGDQEEARPLIESEDSNVRPTSRTIPLFGKQVDSLDYHLHKIPEIIEDIETKRKTLRDNPPRSSGSIFVEFENQTTAYQAYQSIRHHSPMALQPRFIGIQPKEVIWSNLTLSPSWRILYSYLAFAFLTATIIFWAIPIGFIGTISNIDYLTDKVKFLGFINKLPASVLGLIQGFLPSFLLSYVVSYVPKLFRHVMKWSGAATTVAAEESTQKWYFAFQVIQVFLVTTFTSGAATVATKLFNNPSSVLELLADNLPKASNFYLSYFILQGTASAADSLFNYSDLLEYIFYDRFFDSTPRKKYERLSFMRGCPWGAWYPKFANFAVIAIAYSCIAPLVLGFAGLGLFLFYLAYRYNLLYTKQVKIETRGDAYARSLQHILVGVYLLELCLIGLFSTRTAEGPTVLTIILLIATMLYHITVNKFLTPLEENIAMDVLTEEGEEQPLAAIEAGRVEHRNDVEHTSYMKRVAGGKLPTILLDPLASILEPSLFVSHDVLRPWLEEDWSESEETPEYSEDDLKNAYLAPALTSKAPKIWLAKDKNNTSKWEMEKNEAAGLASTDEGAELDEDNKIRWNKDDLSAAPIFKQPKLY